MGGLVDTSRPFLLLCLGTSGIHLGAGAVVVEAVRVFGDRVLLPKRGEQPLEPATAGPATEPCVDCGQVAKAPRQGAALVVVLQDVRMGIDERGVRNPHVSALNRQARMDFSAMVYRDLFHDRAPLDFRLIVDRHPVSSRKGVDFHG